MSGDKLSTLEETFVLAEQQSVVRTTSGLMTTVNTQVLTGNPFGFV